MTGPMMVEKREGPTHALEVGTPKPNTKHVALRVMGPGDTVVHSNGFIVGEDVDLVEMVQEIRRQREGGALGGLALGATEYPSKG